MRYNAAIAVLVSIAPILARAAELKLESADIPDACKSICDPIRDVTDTCDNSEQTHDDGEDQRDIQCVCTSTSVDVISVAALCQSCMKENTGDEDDLDGINNIVSKCGSVSQTNSISQSSAAATSSAQSASVSMSQHVTLTYTPVSASTAAATTVRTTTTTGGNSSHSTTAATSAATSLVVVNAAPAALPKKAGVLAIGVSAAAAAFGAMLML